MRVQHLPLGIASYITLSAVAHIIKKKVHDVFFVRLGYWRVFKKGYYRSSHKPVQFFPLLYFSFLLSLSLLKREATMWTLKA